MRQAWWQRRIYHFQVVSYGVRNPPQSDHITEIWWDSTKCQVEVKRNTNSIHVDNLSTRIQTRENNLMCSFWTHEVGCAVLPAWISCPLPAAFSGSPLRGHRRVSHADGHAVFKVQQAKRKQKSRHRTDQPCLRFFWKVMLVGYVTAESQNVQPRRARTNM